jgi:hypothetical protein
MTVRLVARFKPEANIPSSLPQPEHQKEFIRHNIWTSMLKEVFTVDDGGPQFRWIGYRVSGPSQWGEPGSKFVDALTGDVVLEPSGYHFNLHADTKLWLSNQRWFSFPVRGTSSRNAIMTAVDESGTPVLTFRKVEREGEVLVRWGCHVTTELLCVVAVAAPLLLSYWGRLTSDQGWPIDGAL